MKALPFALVALSIACGAPPPKTRPAPGDEPLETASLADEEVVPLEPQAADAPHALLRERPCSWAKAWSDGGMPDPLLAGVGGTPNPERVASSPVLLPLRTPPPRGEIVVEIVILPDGTISEAKVAAATDPPWPEAESAVLEAVKTWRYEPPTLTGTPIAVCTTVVIRP
jgi:TonB family protein